MNKLNLLPHHIGFLKWYIDGYTGKEVTLDRFGIIKIDHDQQRGILRNNGYSPQTIAHIDRLVEDIVTNKSIPVHISLDKGEDSICQGCDSLVERGGKKVCGRSKHPVPEDTLARDTGFDITREYTTDELFRFTD